MDANPLLDIPQVVGREVLATLRAAASPLAVVRPLPPAAGTSRPQVLLVHGFLGRRSMLRGLHRSLVVAGHTRVERMGYPSTRLRLEQIAARIEQTAVPLARDGKIDLVGHSLGAVACRAWIKAFGGHRYVRRFVSLGGPHGGTRLYPATPPHLWPVLNPDGAWVARLGVGPEPVPTWHIRSRYDHQVLPPRPVVLEGATEVVLANVGHNGLLWSRKAHAAVISALA